MKISEVVGYKKYFSDDVEDAKKKVLSRFTNTIALRKP